MTPIVAWSHADRTLYILVNRGPSPEDNRWDALWSDPPTGPAGRCLPRSVSTLPLPAVQAVEFAPMVEDDGRTTTRPPVHGPRNLDTLRDAMTALASGLDAVIETLRWDGEPTATATALIECVEPLQRVAYNLRVWPRTG
jgi:hypothetical protein